MSQVTPATDVRAITERILGVRASVPRERAALVAVSGIDGCGKGWLARQIVDELQARGVNAANINIDGWLNLPDKRFGDKNPAEHFYLHAISSTLADLGSVGEGIFHALPDMARNFDTVSARP